MKNIIIILFVLFSFNMFSQNYVIKYSYDDAGNRIQRKQLPIMISTEGMTGKLKTDTVIEQIANKDIKIYPNPVTETLNIHIDDYESEIGTINLYSLEGRLITTKKITESNTKINFINQAPGSYIVKIIINNKTKEYTVVKNNK